MIAVVDLPRGGEAGGQPGDLIGPGVIPIDQPVERGKAAVIATRSVCPKDGSDTAAPSRRAAPMTAGTCLRTMGRLMFGPGEGAGFWCSLRAVSCKLRAGGKGIRTAGPSRETTRSPRLNGKCRR